MNKDELKSEVNALIRDFAIQNNLFSLEIKYEGSHECDYDYVLEEDFCTFNTDKLEMNYN